MGLRESYPDLQGDFIEQNWSYAQASPNCNPIHGTYRQMCNNMTREVLDEFRVTCTSQQEFMEHLEWYAFRRREERLVQVKYLFHEGGRQLCSTLFRIRMLMERMALRLTDIKDIPFPENLYVLKASLLGFRLLYGRVGYFPISEDLISMNQQGNVKVWLHPDFSCIKPLWLPVPNATQPRMVTELIQIIHINTDPETDLHPLPVYLHRVKQKQLTFKYALELIDRYAAEYGVQIPTYFETIVKKIRIDQGVECSSQSGTKRGNLGNEHIRDSAGYQVYSNVFKSDSSRTYADKLKAFDSEISHRKSGVLGKMVLQKSQITSNEDKKGREEPRKKMSLYRSHHASCENLNTYFHNYLDKKTPEVRFTFEETEEKVSTQPKTNNPNKNSDNQESSLDCQSECYDEVQSSSLPFSPQSQELSRLQKSNLGEWIKEIMQCGVDLDPQIIEDLIKFR